LIDAAFVIVASFFVASASAGGRGAHRGDCWRKSEREAGGWARIASGRMRRNEAALVYDLATAAGG
jgi:hypothetical protein